MSKQASILFAAAIAAPFSVSAEEVPAAVHELAKTIETWTNNPVLIEAVKTQNNQDLTLDAIKKADATWMALLAG